MSRIISLVIVIILSTSSLVGCLGEDGNEVDKPTDANKIGTDITNAILLKTSPSCADYTGTYYATVTDMSNDETLESHIEISETESFCSLYSNGIPNHNFSINGSFATRTSPVWENFSIPLNPIMSSDRTALSLRYDDAIFINGVKLDLLAAACYGVGQGRLGEEKIGCFESETPWRYDPMHESNSFGEDENNAHTQPDGAYHYHGDPGAMYDTTGKQVSGVIGFAADGFPIRGPFIDDNGTIRIVESGYILREGNRTSQDGEGEFTGGVWDGRFRDDFQWKEGAGDLDHCNGMIYDGSYSYFVTYSYPWVMGCFVGTPDDSFRKGGV